MSSRPTREQLARWQSRECARCGRYAHVTAWWPDGTLCRTCCDRALRLRGRCPGCGDDRALPGLAPDSRDPICTDCAGFTANYRCSRCGDEGKLHAQRLCTRCTFTDKLSELLDDGTGRIRPELVPLADRLLAMNNPLSGLTWLYPREGKNRTPADLLRELGRGQIELTHEAFHSLEPWRAAAHLRELLMACGVLPVVDKQICGFERWLPGHLATITDPDHAQIIRRYATWHLLPQLRAKAERKSLTPPARRHAHDQVKQATLSLEWLAGQGITLDASSQSDIDAWHAQNGSHRRGCLRTFLLWCMNSQLTRQFRLSAPAVKRRPPMPPEERIELLGHILTASDQPLRSRAAAAIVLLYAQPLTRVVRLTIDDVIHDGDLVLLRLGEPASPVPEPVAEILLAWIDSRTNMNTATNRDSRWLFPGRRAGQPMHPETLGRLLKALGVLNVPGRTSAMRQHVQQMPAPVVADALGYHHVTTTKLAAEAAVVWSRYVTTPRFRSPTGWKPSTTRDS
ncbi:hypothetical protein [Nocardia sp. NPDC050710]|uniref:hypothetical protein n=1 Tax=Nocardia sp. NPDC050710 TaxID=3157220 RepID=UPI00340A8D19